MVSRLISLIFVIGLLVTGTGLWLLLDRPVERLRVSGELSPAEQAVVMDRLLQEELGGILSVDIDHLRGVLDGLQWARDITVRRRWPNQLEFNLRRVTPVARWGQDLYVSAEGELLDIPAPQTELPLFSVAHGTPTEAMEIYRLLHQLVRDRQLSIVELSQDAKAEWSVVFREGFLVYLGSGQLDRKINRFMHLYREATMQERQIAYVDMRYSNGAAVRFREMVAISE